MTHKKATQLMWAHAKAEEWMLQIQINAILNIFDVSNLSFL